MEFIHLHNHSHYSILDGAITVDRLINWAVEQNMPAIALTDHGNMFGALEFYLKAKKAGITPIVGEEFYVAPGSRFTKEALKNGSKETAYHLILLAQNEAGYKNLLKLSSLGYTEGFYYNPRIDLEILEKYSDGLICGSACIAGQIPAHILKGQYREARELSGRFKEVFGKDNFFLELQYHGLGEQEIVNKELIKISSELHIPLIATNDAHYVNQEDSYSHEVLLCVQTGKTMNDESRMRFSSDQFYLKTPDEMADIFSDYPDALYSTYRIYEMIDLDLDLGNPILPDFEVPEGYNLDSYLKNLVDKGAKIRYGRDISDRVRKRIGYELSVITNMKFSGYFLIVWDVINHAKHLGIPVGPGRGSAAGSIVSYCLGITALDPLKYDLLFERFLNPDRNEMPDMDLDFCANRREEIIDYVKEKYGADHVSQIVTFNKLKAKAVIKDVARVLDIPFQRANEISKMIEEGTLKESLNRSREFKALYKDEAEGKRLIDISLKLEGLVRSTGKHAAGVVISQGLLTDFVPLYKEPKEGSISSQYEKDTLEKAGLVKMDFLGLKNLTIIDKCLKLIKESTEETVDIELIPLDDEKTFKLFQRADTKGVFQFEKSGVQNILRRIRPTSFEDIIAINALNRPGPSDTVDDFINRKKNPDLVTYPHESLKQVLKDTLGIVVYQEQVMLISQIIAGFTMPEADMLRKAMGKKDEAIISELESKFLEGAEKNKINPDLAEDLYRMIKRFGEYGFNKSHSAAYALIAYQTAYLKAHFPIQFMTALLSAQPDKQEDIIQYINDCRAASIEVLPPSINDSRYDFTIEKNSIRFGLGSIKGIGGKAIENIVKTREKIRKFKSLKDFFETVGLITLNKGVLEALIKSGSFDSVYSNRAQLFNSIEILIDTARKLQEDKASGQGNLFTQDNTADNDQITIDLPKSADWHDNEKLAHEKEVLGLYISGHPLVKYENEIRTFSSISISEISENYNGKRVSIVGIISNLQIRKSQKNGHRYGIGTLEDLDGVIEIIFFQSVLKKYEDLIMSGEPVMITGTVETEGETARKIISSVIKTLKQVKRESISAIHISIDPSGTDEDIFNTLKATFLRHKGDCPIFFHVNKKEGKKTIKVNSSFNITPSENLVKDLMQIVGQESLKYTIGHH